MAARSEFSTYWLMTRDGKLLEEVDSPGTIPKLSGLPVIEGVNLTLPTQGAIAEFDDVLSGKTAMDLVDAVIDAGLGGSGDGAESGGSLQHHHAGGRRPDRMAGGRRRRGL